MSGQTKTFATTRSNRRSHTQRPSSRTTTLPTVMILAFILVCTYAIIKFMPQHPISKTSITVVNSSASKRPREDFIDTHTQQEQEHPITTEHINNDEQCHFEQDTDYYAPTLVKDGINNIANSPEECCQQCYATEGCNVFVYCNAQEGGGGCSGGDEANPRQRGECWLKHIVEDINLLRPEGQRIAGIGWLSGVAVTKDVYQTAAEKKTQEQQAEEQRLAALKQDERLPLVYFDVEINNNPIGRIEMVLYTDISPKAAENFRQLCTGEHSPQHHLKGASFYRIIDQFIDQSGINVESIYGGQFKDDKGGLQLKHDKKGLLSMANLGPDTNTAHFSIIVAPAPHLNGKYVVFGQAVSGFDVIDAINALSKGKPDNTADASAGAVIMDVGQIRKGTLVPDLTD